MKTSFSTTGDIKIAVKTLTNRSKEEKPEEILLQAVMLFLREEVGVRFQTFASTEKLLRLGSTDEGDDKEKSPLDDLFDALQKKNPNCMAVKRYRTFKMLPSDDQKWAYFRALSRIQQVLDQDNYC